MNYRLRRSRFAGLALAVGALVLTAAMACSSSSSPTATQAPAATNTPPPATATTAPSPTAAAATPTATVAASTPQPTVTSQATATAAPTPVASATPAPTPGSQSASITAAITEIFPIAGEPYMSTYSATEPLGVLDYLFKYSNGNEMAPDLATGWQVASDGSSMTFTIRKGVPWNPPKGFESMSSWLGNVSAQDIADYINTCNATTNPSSTCGDAGDFAAWASGPAVAVDQYTVKVPLVSPVYYCTPLTEFGCLDVARAPNLTLREVNKMGKKWAEAHTIGTGPMVQGTCVEGNRCTSWSLPTNWAGTADLQSFTYIQVPEAATRIAMLKNGQAQIAEADFSLVPNLMQQYKDGKSNIRYIQTIKGEYVTQSILFSGNLWEKDNPLTGAALNPWNSNAYAQDYPWIGNPWPASETKYTDTNNPPGMTDMEQARLVRLALSTAICRDQINQNILGGLGIAMFGNEDMGPGFPGWDASSTSGVWDVQGNQIAATGTEQSVPWKYKDCDIQAAGKLLDEAGYPANSSGQRTGFTPLKFNVYAAEAGQVDFPVAASIESQWSKLGIQISELDEAYGSVVSQRMRQREQYWPVMKNGDGNSNLFVLTWPLPPTDTAMSRPGWGTGFETPFGAKSTIAIEGTQDAAQAKQMHLANVNYIQYWQLNPGVFEVPIGLLVTPEIKDWNQNPAFFAAAANFDDIRGLVVNSTG